MNIEPLSPFRMQRWNRDNRLEVAEDNDTGRVVGYRGFDQSIVPFDVGGVGGVSNVVPEFTLLSEKYERKLDDQFNHGYFRELCKGLQAHGYREHINLHGMPYDFRRILDPMSRHFTFKTLQRMIEMSVERSGREAVVCAHSLGGIVFKLFLGEHVSQKWVDTYIRKFVSVNVPYGGLPSVVKSVYYGDYFIPYFQELFKDHLKVNSGIIMTLPNRLGYTDPRAVFLEDDGTGEKISTASFETSDYISFRIWRDLWRDKLFYMEKEVDMDTHIVNSYGMLVGTRFDGHKATECECGDGIVPKTSLDVYKRLFTPGRTQVEHLDSYSHVKIVRSPELLNIVTSCN
jgi:hypothetical protein